MCSNGILSEKQLKQFLLLHSQEEEATELLKHIMKECNLNDIYTGSTSHITVVKQGYKIEARILAVSIFNRKK